MNTLDPERWRQVEELFQAARSLPAGEPRAYVEQAAGEPGIAGEVLSLLDAQRRAGDFLEQPGEAAPGDHAGPWKLEREVGRGGMGVVYLATRADGRYEKTVALKLLRSEFQATDLVARFRREWRILAGLEHPNIARLLDAGAAGGGRPYLAMEYVNGEPLDAWCERRKLGITQRLRLFLKVCAGVQYAHQNLIIHRDLKPGNILVTAAGEPKLLDFGVAKVLEPGDSEDNTALLRPLTPRYASPEQFRGEPTSTATDVYSLGVVLYKLLTGATPFAASTSTDVMRQVLTQEAPPPSTHAPQLRGDLDNIVVKALQREPRQRYPSVQALAEDIERHLAGFPVRAREATLAYRTSKFLRRNRLPVGAAALVAGALITGTLVARSQARVAQRERVKAEKINEFMRRSLGAADPSWLSPHDKGGVELRVVDVLETASRNAAGELAALPEAEADLRRTLGTTYMGLGLYRQALPELERAAALHRRLYGERHPETARTLVLLGQALYVGGDPGGAERAFRQVLALGPGRTAYERVSHIMALGNLGVTLHQAGRAKEGAPLLAEAVERCRAALGSATSLCATALGNLGLAYDDRGELERAAGLYQEAIGVFRQLPGRPPMELAWSLLNLGGVQQVKGEHRDAVRWIREAVAIFETRAGHEAPHVATSLTLLARSLAPLGETAEAEAVARRALAIHRTALTPEHPEFGRSLSALGAVLLAEAKHSEAERTLRQALSVRRKTMPPGHRRIADAAGLLGQCLAAQGRQEEAEPLLRESYESFRNAFGDSDPRTREALGHLRALRSVRR